MSIVIYVNTVKWYTLGRFRALLSIYRDRSVFNPKLMNWWKSVCKPKHKNRTLTIRTIMWSQCFNSWINVVCCNQLWTKLSFVRILKHWVLKGQGHTKVKNIHNISWWYTQSNLLCLCQRAKTILHRHKFMVKMRSKVNVLQRSECGTLSHGETLTSKYGLTMLKDQKAVVRTQRHAINPFYLTLRSKVNVLSGSWMFIGKHQCAKYGKPMSKHKKLWAPWNSFTGGIMNFAGHVWCSNSLHIISDLYQCSTSADRYTTSLPCAPWFSHRFHDELDHGAIHGVQHQAPLLGAA